MIKNENDNMEEQMNSKQAAVIKQIEAAAGFAADDTNTNAHGDAYASFIYWESATLREVTIKVGSLGAIYLLRGSRSPERITVAEIAAMTMNGEAVTA